jgi:prepilin signal peptidase PulO-like enzyme (type II secretory pathway)
LQRKGEMPSVNVENWKTHNPTPMNTHRRYLGLGAVAAGIFGGFIDPGFAAIPVRFVSYAVAAGVYAPAAWPRQYRCTAVTLLLLPFTTVLLAIVFVDQDTDLISATMGDARTNPLRAGLSLLIRAVVVISSAVGLDRLATNLPIPRSIRLTVQLLGVVVLLDVATLLPWGRSDSYLTPLVQVGVGDGDLSRHLLYLPLGLGIAAANVFIRVHKREKPKPGSR